MPEYISPDAVIIPGWVAFCGRLAPFSSILMFLSPIPTIRQVLRNGTVGDLPLLPYTAMTASCFVWIIYGILRGEPSIYVTNLIEFVLSLYYFVEFTNYAPKTSPTFPGSVYSHIKLCVGIWTGSIFVALFFRTNSSIATIGDLTVLLTILTFASPLAALKAVLESKSSESIPWPFTLAALFNCCLWSIVGVFDMHDIYVYSPAVLGLIFACLQVAIKLHFGDHNGMNNQDNPTFTRPPVDMPYPVLGSVRQVVMFGNTTINNTSSQSPSSYYNINNQQQHNHHDLILFEHHNNNNHNNSITSNADYVELGVPLTQNPSGDLQSLVSSSQQSSSQTPFGGGGSGFMNPSHQPHHKHRNSNDGLLEYSTVEGLESIVFDVNDNEDHIHIRDGNIGDNVVLPPPPTALRDSFRSRSSGVFNHNQNNNNNNNNNINSSSSSINNANTGSNVVGGEGGGHSHGY